MWRVPASLCLMLCTALPAAAQDNPAAAAMPLVDGHNDLIIHFIDWNTGEFRPAEAYDISGQQLGQSDIPRLRTGGVGAAIFTIWTPDDNAPEAGLQQSVDLFTELARRNPDDLAIVTSPAALLAAHAAGRIGVVLSLEGGNPVEGDVGRLGWMHQRGVSAMGLVWSTNGIGGAGRNDAEAPGLTPLGEDVVREMNRLGMIVDVAHASPATVADVVRVSRAPVIDSHAVSARFMDEADDNTEASARAVAQAGGIVMPMFMPEAISADYRRWKVARDAHFAQAATRLYGEDGANLTVFLPWPADLAAEMEPWIAANPPPATTLADIADVYDHLRSVVGIDHIGIGSDFDGMGFHPTDRHPALPDAAALPALLAELSRRGWTDEDLAKLRGGNFLRVWQEIIDRAEIPAGEAIPTPRPS